jgi:electron transfer flavoprotein alpha subunit
VHATTLGQIEDEDVGPAPVILLIGNAIKVTEQLRAVEELATT